MAESRTPGHATVRFAAVILLLTLACGSLQQAGRQISLGGGEGDDIRGTVTVTPSGRGYTLRVLASGLVPARTYALHLHRGRCVGPDSVGSRLELPSMRADTRGEGAVTTLVENGPRADPGTVLHIHGGNTAGTAEYRKVVCTPLPR